MSKPLCNTKEREVVLADDLALFLRKALAPMLEAFDEGNTKVGVYENLAAQSGVPVRRIYGILNGEQVMVDLDLADRLLLALGYFVELELPDAIVPEYEVRTAALMQTQMMRHYLRARGGVWPTDRKAMRQLPLQIRKEVWAATHPVDETAAA